MFPWYELGRQNPHIIIKLINVYFSSFYVSNLYSIFNCDKSYLYSTWNDVIRNIFELPYQTHRYLIEPVFGTSHLFTVLNNHLVIFIIPCVTRINGYKKSKTCSRE